MKPHEGSVVVKLLLLAPPGIDGIAEGPDLAPALEHLFVDIQLVDTLVLGDGVDLRQIFRGSIAKPHGLGAARGVELDLIFAMIPRGLGFITVGINHALILPNPAPEP